MKVRKKRIILYVSLFIVSMLVSAFAISAFADSEEIVEMSVSYEQTAVLDHNQYVINIPSTLSFEEGETTKVFNITADSGYDLEDGYQVNVYLTPSNYYDSYNSPQLYLYLDGNNASTNYKFAYTVNANGTEGYDAAIKETTADSTPLFKLTNRGVDTTANGVVTLTHLPNYSTSYQNMYGGTYTGVLRFKIVGSN